MVALFLRHCRPARVAARGRGVKLGLEMRALPQPIDFSHPQSSGNAMSDSFHATTIVSVRRDGKVVIGGDGQVTLGNTVVKANARKLRRLAEGKVLAGFAGATADAFTLFELFEQKLERHTQLTRAAVELAKDWR